MKLTDGEQIEPYSEEKTRDIFRQLLLGESRSKILNDCDD